jgi:hypothetical protein
MPVSLWLRSARNYVNPLSFASIRVRWHAQDHSCRSTEEPNDLVSDTIAEELAARLGWPFEEGDSLHPESNIAKMHAGIPLTDADRLPWLERVAAWIESTRASLDLKNPK